MADFLTIDVYRDPVRHTPARRRSIRAALANRPEGLRAHTINHANTGTFTLIPRHYGTCLLLAWESGDAARSAWHGPLGAALGRAGDYRLDGEVARARTEHPEDHWHGWRPTYDDVVPIANSEPMVVLVHGVVRPRYLTTFLHDNLHARQPCPTPPRPPRQHRRAHQATVREHVDQHLEHTRLSPGLRLPTWGPRACHETRPRAGHPSDRRLPPSPTTGQHRQPRHRPAGPSRPTRGGPLSAPAARRAPTSRRLSLQTQLRLVWFLA
jgi:hypothetical protein